MSVVDNKIYLIHQTARDFLASRSATDHIKADHSLSKRSWKHSLSLMKSNLRLLKIRVAIILFQDFEDDSTGPYAAIGQADPKSAEFLFAEMIDGTTAREVRALILTKPHAGFLEYAADLWSYHLHAASDAISDDLLERILKLCDVRSRKFCIWYWIQYIVSVQSTPTLLSLFLFLGILWP